jgi:cytochrome c oxidase subunit 3
VVFYRIRCFNVLDSGGVWFSRFKFIETWPLADEVFTHLPFMHGVSPYVLRSVDDIYFDFSSVTMVLAVDAGHQKKKNKVVLYMFLTIIGLIFVGSQAWEWKTSSKGNTVLLKQRRKFTQFVDKEGNRSVSRICNDFT